MVGWVAGMDRTGREQGVSWICFAMGILSRPDLCERCFYVSHFP
jgi:hypothetical protein